MSLKSAPARPEQQVLKLFRFGLRGFELVRMDDLFNVHDDILEPLDVLTTALKMAAKNCCAKGTQFRIPSIRREQF